MAPTITKWWCSVLNALRKCGLGWRTLSQLSSEWSEQISTPCTKQCVYIMAWFKDNGDLVQRQRYSRTNTGIIEKGKSVCLVTNFQVVYHIRKSYIHAGHINRKFRTLCVSWIARVASEQNNQKLRTTKRPEVTHNYGCGAGQLSPPPVLRSGSTVFAAGGKPSTKLRPGELVEHLVLSHTSQTYHE